MLSTGRLKHITALALIDAVTRDAPEAVSVVVADAHGEVIAALRIDEAALDMFENARRKAYTAARSDATTTRALADKVAGNATELATSTRSSPSS